MSIHDWTRVEDGSFHDFHHAWIEEIKRSLNAGLLPKVRVNLTVGLIGTTLYLRQESG